MIGSGEGRRPSELSHTFLKPEGNVERIIFARSAILNLTRGIHPIIFNAGEPTGKGCPRASPTFGRARKRLWVRYISNALHRLSLASKAFSEMQKR